ncbi:MAG TPA: SURF1 family protein [Burkholderiales bacterium]
MPAGYSFRPRAWGLALGAAACVAGIALGAWQARRAEEKRALGANLPRVEARGVFLPEHTVFLDNKVRHQRAGYEVITPLQTSAGPALVNRGWIAAGPSRDVLPQVRTPAGEVRVEGVQLERFPRVLIIEKISSGKVRQSIDIAEFAVETGLKLQPRVIEQHSAADDGLLREWPRAEASAEKSEGYSLTWYSLALLAAVLTLVLSFRRAAP